MENNSYISMVGEVILKLSASLGKARGNACEGKRCKTINYLQKKTIQLNERK